MRSSIVCKKCQKLGRAVCACWLAGWAVVVPIKDLGLPPAHAVDALMSTATTTTSGSAISGSGSFTHDQVVGRPRIGVRQDRQREIAQAATSSPAEETVGTAAEDPRRYLPRWPKAAPPARACSSSVSGRQGVMAQAASPVFSPSPDHTREAPERRPSGLEMRWVPPAGLSVATREDRVLCGFPMIEECRNPGRSSHRPVSEC